MPKCIILEEEVSINCVMYRWKPANYAEHVGVTTEKNSC